MKHLFIILLFCSCSTTDITKKYTPVKKISQGEVILGSQLLTKIFDQEMAPLSCVPDTDEASLLLRTIHPYMEIIQDDLEAILDSDAEIKSLVETCNQNCTCTYIDELLRENLVTLKKGLRKNLDKMKKQKDLNSCLNYAKETFCGSELYKQLEREKGDFSYDEDSL